MNETSQIRRSIFWAIVIFAISAFGMIIIYSRGFIYIKPLPPISKVVFDGKVYPVRMGTAKIIADPGEYQLQIIADGYASYNQKIVVKRGFNKTMPVNLTQNQSPVLAAESGQYLTKGSDFDNGYYIGDAGTRIFRVKYEIDSESQLKVYENLALTDNRINGVKEFILSPTKELALFRKNDGVYLFDFNKYDFINQTERLWGENIYSITWAPDNSKIAYVYAPPLGERTLVFSNLTNTEITRIINLKEQNISNPLLHFAPDSRFMTIIPRDVLPERNKLYLFDTYLRKLTVANENGYQYDSLFSPDANKILFSTVLPTESSKKALSIMDKDGQNQKFLDVYSTSSQSAWSPSSDSIATIATNPEGKDTIIWVNIASGEKKEIWMSDDPKTRVHKLSYLSNGKIIIFETENGIFAIKAEN